MLSHPDYPSLLSLTDALEELHVEYTAMQVDKEKIYELSFPLLAHTNGDFSIISSLAEVQRNKDDFMKAWDGIALMVQQGSRVQSKEHNSFIKKQKAEQQKWMAVTTGAIILFLAASLIYFNIYFFLFSLLSIGGIGICSLIILHAFGKDNKLTKQLCSTDGTEGCDKVLQSKAGKLGKDFTFADIGLIYFEALFLFQFIAAITNNISDTFTLLLVPATLSFVFTFFSIYYQWSKVKSWCRLCLIVAAIVWLQWIVMISYLLSPASLLITDISWLTPALLFFVSSFLVSSSWLFIKPLLLKADEVETKETELLKWKRNADVFLSLLYQQREVDVVPWEEDITLGNPNASVQITVACNPYCSPCANAHKQIEELLKANDDSIGITIRFTVNANNKEDKRTIAVEHILNAYYSSPTRRSGGVLDDWFEWMNLEKWKLKYSSSLEKDYEEVLKQHEKWCKQSSITHTPTIFVNGYELPKQYKIKDLQLLILTITERIALIPVAADTV